MYIFTCSCEPRRMLIDVIDRWEVWKISNGELKNISDHGQKGCENERCAICGAEVIYDIDRPSVNANNSHMGGHPYD